MLDSHFNPTLYWFIKDTYRIVRCAIRNAGSALKIAGGSALVITYKHWDNFVFNRFCGLSSQEIAPTL